MKPYFGLLIAVCFALFVSGQANAVEAPKGFRSLNWSSSAIGGLKKLSGPTSDGTSLYVPASGKKPVPLLEVAVAEEAYAFTKGKFYCGFAWLDGRENFDKMRLALTKIYGQPSFSNLRQELYKWKWAGTKIEVSLYYQAKFSRATVTFLNDSI